MEFNISIRYKLNRKKEVYLIGNLPPFRRNWHFRSGPGLPNPSLIDPFLKENKTLILDSFAEEKIYMISPEGTLTEVNFTEEMIDNTEEINYDKHNCFVNNSYIINDNLILIDFGKKTGYGCGILKKDGSFLELEGFGKKIIDSFDDIRFYSETEIFFKKGDKYLILNFEDSSILEVLLPKGKRIHSIYYKGDNGDIYCEIINDNSSNEGIGKIDNKGKCEIIEIKNKLKIYESFKTEKGNHIFFSVYKGSHLLILNLEKFDLQYNEVDSNDGAYIRGITKDNIVIVELPKSTIITGITFMDINGNTITENIPEKYKYPEIDKIDYDKGEVIVKGTIGDNYNNPDNYIIPFKTKKDFSQ